MASTHYGSTTFLLLAMLAVAIVSISMARPIRETRSGCSDSIINDINLQLKHSVNALFFMSKTELISQQMNACRLWNEVTTSSSNSDIGCIDEGNSTNATTVAANANYDGENSTNATAAVDNTNNDEYIRNLTCQKISQETDFSIIQEDGSCSEDVLEFLCSRNSQLETYDLFDQINVDLDHNAYNQWVIDTFNDSLNTQQLQKIFS